MLNNQGLQHVKGEGPHDVKGRVAGVNVLITQYRLKLDKIH